MLFPLGVQRWRNGGVLMIVKPVVRSVAQSVLSEAVGKVLSLLPIHNVVVFGASIMNGAFEDRNDAMARFGVNGHLVAVYERATSGDDTGQMVARLPAIISEFQDRAANTLFVIHWGGNNVSRDGPYPGGASDMEAEARSMLTDIKAAGFYVMMSDVSYRVPPASNPAQPYNDAFMYQLQSEFNDIDWFLHQYTFENQALIDPDGIHPTDALKAGIRQHLVDQASPFIVKEDVPASVLTDVVIEFGVNTLMPRAAGSNRINAGETITDLRNSDYSRLVGSSLTVVDATGRNSEGWGNTGDPGNKTVSLFNDEALKDSLYVASGGVMTVDLSGLPLEDTVLYTVGISGSRNTSSGDRLTEYTVDGVTKVLDAELSPPGQVYFTNVTGAALKASPIEVQAQSGSSFGYASVMQLLRQT